MTGSSRSPIRSLGVLLVLALALVAMFAISPSAAQAVPQECAETPENPSGECKPVEADACPDLPGMQTAGANCTPAPAPDPAPTPADSLPDEGYIAPAPAEFEHGSLTLQAAQDDPAATTGGETIVAAAGAAEAPGSGTSSAATTAVPSGPLPYTGSVATNVAIAGVALLWIGGLSYLVAGILRRRAAGIAA